MGELGGLGGESIDMGCAQVGIAMAAEIAESLVVGEDDQNVRPRRFLGAGFPRCKHEGNRQGCLNAVLKKLPTRKSRDSHDATSREMEIGLWIFMDGMKILRQVLICVR